MDGYIRRILATDGYALVRPVDFLEDGASYHIMRNGSLIAPAIAITIGPKQIILTKSDPGIPLNIVNVDDLVVKIG